ncbi:SulP family inorganic anion transporter [Streptomyces acidiscabies]|uniref:SulP family inorganic anion transporter n=1 Tax=Streptomyces acidiscabies TaxID=42234 RepID=UPI00073E4B30|nr:SulP family inorganic anion transporter [Streptomyces acidiscabies]GAQ55517.1 C4-dicarboxylic acid transporter DauA [Streptomyces acidiscabies]GAV41613.1 C4-dicarboxylic acid transporter DauA [Streptomyces acidiscabies]
MNLPLPTLTDLRTLTHDPRRNLLCGLTVAVVALPLALGFGVSSGLGAASGLATAIVAGALAALFGGSARQVSGPTGAMTVVLVPIVHHYGPDGVLTVGLLAGLILIALSFARAGAAMAYVPAPVIAGFTVGIAAVIALQQIPNALGVPVPHGEQVAAVAARAAEEFEAAPHWPALLLSTGSAALVLAGARWKPTIPFSLAAVGIATAVAETLNLDVTRIGTLPPSLPTPSLSFLDVTRIPTLLAPAVAVAALAALESLLSASVADEMSKNRRPAGSFRGAGLHQFAAPPRGATSHNEPAPAHNPSKELFGQGIANLAAPLFGGVPATGAIARTAVNVRTGATSRLAALTHAVILAGIVAAAAPLVSRIPLAALAGVLLATAIRMVETGPVRAMARATKGDALVLLLTAASTLALDLVRAVLIGLAVSTVLALKAAATTTRLTPAATNEHPGTESISLRYDGPLLFAGAHSLRRALTDVHGVNEVELKLSGLTAMDATGALALKDAVGELRGRGVDVHLSDIGPAHRHTLESVGLLPAPPTPKRGAIPRAAEAPAP